VKIVEVKYSRGMLGEMMIDEVVMGGWVSRGGCRRARGREEGRNATKARSEIRIRHCVYTANQRPRFCGPAIVGGGMGTTIAAQVHTAPTMMAQALRDQCIMIMFILVLLPQWRSMGSSI
jgi:hypothetical protein